MGKCITDAFGKVKHWVLSDNDFVYEYSNYERDAYTGRYYRLTESTSLKPEMDGGPTPKYFIYCDGVEVKKCSSQVEATMWVSRQRGDKNEH